MVEMMKFAGWASPGPAGFYVNAREERLKALAKDTVESKTEESSFVRGLLKRALKAVA